jgi:hypothetical protein
LVLLIVALNDRLKAGPPAVGATLLTPPPAPPCPIINPLLTMVSVSPVVPPVKPNPALPVDVAYKYTPELTVIVISETPAIYPLIPDRFNDAFAVFDA